MTAGLSTSIYVSRERPCQCCRGTSRVQSRLAQIMLERTRTRHSVRSAKRRIAIRMPCYKLCSVKQREIVSAATSSRAASWRRRGRTASACARAGAVSPASAIPTWKGLSWLSHGPSVDRTRRLSSAWRCKNAGKMQLLKPCARAALPTEGLSIDSMSWWQEHRFRKTTRCVMT